MSHRFISDMDTYDIKYQILQHLCAYASETLSPVSSLIFALSHRYPCDGYFK